MNEASLQQIGYLLWCGSRIHFLMAVVRINQSVAHCLDRLAPNNTPGDISKYQTVALYAGYRCDYLLHSARCTVTLQTR